MSGDNPILENFLENIEEPRLNLDLDANINYQIWEGGTGGANDLIPPFFEPNFRLFGEFEDFELSPLQKQSEAMSPPKNDKESPPASSARPQNQSKVPSPGKTTNQSKVPNVNAQPDSSKSKQVRINLTKILLDSFSCPQSSRNLKSTSSSMTLTLTLTGNIVPVLRTSNITSYRPQTIPLTPREAQMLLYRDKNMRSLKQYQKQQKRGIRQGFTNVSRPNVPLNAFGRCEADIEELENEIRAKRNIAAFEPKRPINPPSLQQQQAKIANAVQDKEQDEIQVVWDNTNEQISKNVLNSKPIQQFTQSFISIPKFNHGASAAAKSVSTADSERHFQQAPVQKKKLIEESQVERYRQQQDQQSNIQAPPKVAAQKQSFTKQHLLGNLRFEGDSGLRGDYQARQGEHFGQEPAKNQSILGKRMKPTAQAHHQHSNTYAENKRGPLHTNLLPPQSRDVDSIQQNSQVLKKRHLIDASREDQNLVQQQYYAQKKPALIKMKAQNQRKKSLQDGKAAPLDPGVTKPKEKPQLVPLLQEESQVEQTRKTTSQQQSPQLVQSNRGTPQFIDLEMSDLDSGIQVRELLATQTNPHPHATSIQRTSDQSLNLVINNSQSVEPSVRVSNLVIQMNLSDDDRDVGLNQISTPLLRQQAPQKKEPVTLPSLQKCRGVAQEQRRSIFSHVNDNFRNDYQQPAYLTNYFLENKGQARHGEKDHLKQRQRLQADWLQATYVAGIFEQFLMPLLSKSLQNEDRKGQCMSEEAIQQVLDLVSKQLGSEVQSKQIFKWIGMQEGVQEFELHRNSTHRVCLQHLLVRQSQSSISDYALVVKKVRSKAIETRHQVQ